MLYISYGSNLNLKQMEKRCPTGKVYGKGVLKNYKLLFRGKADGAFLTIEPEDGSDVPVGVWEIQPADEESLDKYEGFPDEYYKADIQIVMEDGSDLTGMIYIMTEGQPLNKPSDAYHETVLEGYRDFGFDAKYIEKALEKSIG